jgi:hypothetical protein
MKTCGAVDVDSTYFGPRHQVDVNGQIHTPVALPQGKQPFVSIVQEAEYMNNSGGESRQNSHMEELEKNGILTLRWRRTENI